MPTGVYQIQFTDSAYATGTVFQTNAAQNFPGWAEIEPTEGNFDFSTIDKKISAAKALGKKVGLTVAFLPDPPAWLSTKYGVTIYQVPHGSHGNVPWFNPWDPVAEPIMLQAMAVLCQHEDNLPPNKRADYMVIDGVGMVTESYLPDLTIIGENATSVVPKWTGSTGDVIDTYGANLHNIYFVMACAPPIPGNANALAALQNVVLAKESKWPLFSAANYGANPNTNYQGGFVPNVLIHQFHLDGHFSGFQCSTQNGIGPNYQGTLSAVQACDGVYLESWTGDTKASSNADAIAAFNAAVAPGGKQVPMTMKDGRWIKKRLTESKH
jgi:hypothetical protein